MNNQWLIAHDVVSPTLTLLRLGMKSKQPSYAMSNVKYTILKAFAYSQAVMAWAIFILILYSIF